MNTITIDMEHRIITVYGVSYALELFEHLGIGELGTWLRIVKREDGVVTCERKPGGEDPPEEETITTGMMPSVTDELRGIADGSYNFNVRSGPRRWPDGHD